MTMTASGVFLAAVLGGTIAGVIAYYFTRVTCWIDRSSGLYSLGWMTTKHTNVVGLGAIFGALGANLGTVITGSILQGMVIALLLSLGYCVLLIGLAGVLWIGTAKAR